MLYDKNLKLPVVFDKKLSGMFRATTGNVHELIYHNLLANRIHFIKITTTAKFLATCPIILNQTSRDLAVFDNKYHVVS